MADHDRLADYRTKRDFEATPEPQGQCADSAPDRPRFVIQQHSATRLHWDLRLEHDGVLVSWALPRGIPWTPAENHLAVHTEDHPMEYLDFHGDIPDGQYGAGTMTVWDRGWYETEEFESAKVVAVLHGERTTGRYALFATRGRDWMIHRMDPPVDPQRQTIPSTLRPMTASPGPLPTGAGWAFEPHWEGLRVLVVCAPGHVALVDADGADRTASFPEVRPIGRATGSTEVVLDGIVTSPTGGPGLIDRRLAARSESTQRRLARTEPVAVVLVDTLWFDGHPTLARPWDDRRERLDGLGLEGDAWTTPHAFLDGGADLLAAVSTQGLPGVMAKARRSAYRPGERSPDWVDVGA